MVDVFISYPRLERDRAERIKGKLEALKLDIFFDIEGIDGGAVFPRVISNALDASKAIVCCWSPLYFNRPWCVMEAREGLSRDSQSARILPVCLERFERTAPDVEFRSLNYFDLTNWSGEDEHEDWNRTLLTLGKLVGRELALPLKKGLFGGVKAAGAAPQAPNLIVARADIVVDLRETWRDFPARDEEAAVAKFLAHVRMVAPGSGLAFEIEYHIDLLRRVEAGRLAEVQAALTAYKKREQILGPAVIRARESAKSGRSVAERTFPIELASVTNWPTPQMIAVPPGTFLMGAPAGEEGGSDDDRPQHQVRIDYSFALGQHTVTFAEWDSALAAGAKLEKPDDWGWGRETRPVINVSWEDAQAYIAWLNSLIAGEESPLLNASVGVSTAPVLYRLPSEAEWEYACRAGRGTPFSFGATIGTDQANYDGNSTYGDGRAGEFRAETMPVGCFTPNRFGLYQMHGNVLEWCEDVLHDNYVGAPTDGSPWVGTGSSFRVARGGSWSDAPLSLRSAARDGGEPYDRVPVVGFRLAMTLSPPNPQG